MSSLLKREIPTDLYVDYKLFGIDGKDLPWVLLVGLLAPPVFMFFGYPFRAVLFPLIWFATVIPFLQWSRVNRRPLWLTHFIKCKLYGKTYNRVVQNSWKQSIYK